ncbi:F-box domain containing protein [Trema orientale]|uniref:F-box domain containing protein n=1 Tax=Trema orientale TaxID=63057 RepID=A0A2P5F2J6_TREOI|nr:F-box domain containing protein [Trema orientale]
MELLHEEGTTHSLPEDLIVRIMSKLPVKSLIRFKCVSKRWHTIITTDSHLTTTHLDRSKSNKLCIVSGNECLSTFPVRKYVDRMLLLRDESTVEDVDIVLFHHSFEYEIVGSCNGLVCVALVIINRTWIVDTVLWNPATKGWRYLTEPTSSESQRRDSNLLSFGYDHDHNDYKLVRVELNNAEERRMARVHVFSRSRDSWRQVTSRDLPDRKVAGEMGIIVNGVMYLMGYENNSSGGNIGNYTILTFNLCDEKFGHDIRPPIKNNSMFSFSKWKDCLALMEVETHSYSFWVKGDGSSGTEKHTWTGLLKVKLATPAADYYFAGVWKNGFLFAKYLKEGAFDSLDSGELISIDPLSHNQTTLKKIGKKVRFSDPAFEYVESLLSVYS